MTIEKAIWPKKFDVPVHVAIHLRCRCLTTYARPSFSSGSIFGFGCPSTCFGTFSAARIGSMNAVEMRKLAASSAIAYGAVRTPIRTPARPGPPICAAETVVWSFELPSTSCSRSTSEGRYDWYAMSKKTVQMPIANWSAISCQMSRIPSAQATGM